MAVRVVCMGQRVVVSIVSTKLLAQCISKLVNTGFQDIRWDGIRLYTLGYISAAQR